MDDQTLLDAVNAQILALTTGGVAGSRAGDIAPIGMESAATGCGASESRRACAIFDTGRGDGGARSGPAAVLTREGGAESWSFSTEGAGAEASGGMVGCATIGAAPSPVSDAR